MSDNTTDCRDCPGASAAGGPQRAVADLLVGRGLTIATAESCSAGLVSYLLTCVPGSSQYFRGGIVAYADDVKTELAGVRQDLLARFGAVSDQVARAMAEGARETVGTDIGVGITGIAGPGGATAAKPVGIVYIAVAGPGWTRSERLALAGNRAAVRWQSAQAALDLVRHSLEQWGEPR